jgi:non-specific serine/threonine protein kinase
VLDLLSHLVEKSLVIVEEAARGEARYRLLETVRQYARDRLLESGEAPALRGRHLDFFLHFAEQGEPELHGPEQAAWFERLEAEHDNLRAALEWSLAPEGGGEAGLRLAGALWWFWVIRGHFQEGQSWLERALERSGGVPALRAKALEGAGWIAAHRGDFAATRAFVEQELAIGRELGDKRIIATSYRALGWVASLQGDSASARPFYEQALALEQEVGTGQP